MAPRRLDQLVAMRGLLGDDRHAIVLEPFEYLRLGRGDRLHRAEIFDMRGGNRGDECDVGAHQPGQRGDLAGVVHA